MVVEVFEVEYDVADREVARKLAQGHAGHLLSHPAVLAVTVDEKKGPHLPITERYLEDEPVARLSERVSEYTPPAGDLDAFLERINEEDGA